MDAFDTLGVAPNCTKDIAKAAYRRLASQHHPDRGGSKEVFQNVQAAWDAIDRGYRRTIRKQADNPYFSSKQASSFSEAFNDYFKNSKQPFKPTPGQQKPSQSYGYGKREMRNGAVVVEVPVSDTPYVFEVGDFEYTIPAFMPDGWEGTVTGKPIVIGSQKRPPEIKACVKLVGPTDTNMVFRGLPDVRNGYRNEDPNLAFTTNIGDCVQVIRTNAINLIVGAWVSLVDCFGKTTKMRIPSGFNPERRLRVAGAGFYKWDTFSEKPIINQRGDMIIHIIPEFTTLKNADVGDLENLKANLTGL